jgi:hypothetical protein
MSSQKPTYQKPLVAPYRPGENQVEATRRTSDELERAVRDAIDRQTGEIGAAHAISTP